MQAKITPRAVAMLSLLRSALSGMGGSVNRRVDAELCIIKLCAPAATPAAPAPTAPAAPPPAAMTAPAPAPAPAAAPPPPQDIAKRIAAAAGPLYAAYLDGARFEEVPDGLRIFVREEFSASMLREPKFTALLRSLYPGQPSVFVENSLESLLGHKDIVTEID